MTLLMNCTQLFHSGTLGAPYLSGSIPALQCFSSRCRQQKAQLLLLCWCLRLHRDSCCRRFCFFGLQLTHGWRSAPAQCVFSAAAAWIADLEGFCPVRVLLCARMCALCLMVTHGLTEGEAIVTSPVVCSAAAALSAENAQSKRSGNCTDSAGIHQRIKVITSVFVSL